MILDRSSNCSGYLLHSLFQHMALVQSPEHPGIRDPYRY